MLPERRQYKKVIAWNGDFGMDQYVPWNLSNEDLMLNTIWEKFEEFCKPQSNEVRASFHPTTSLIKSSCCLDESCLIQTYVLFQRIYQLLNDTYRMRNLHKEKKFDSHQVHKRKDRCSMCGDSKHVEGFKCLPGSSSAKPVTSIDLLQACVTREKCLLSPEHPRCISYKLD